MVCVCLSIFLKSGGLVPPSSYTSFIISTLAEFVKNWTQVVFFRDFPGISAFTIDGSCLKMV